MHAATLVWLGPHATQAKAHGHLLSAVHYTALSLQRQTGQLLRSYNKQATTVTPRFSDTVGDTQGVDESNYDTNVVVLGGI